MRYVFTLLAALMVANPCVGQTTTEKKDSKPATKQVEKKKKPPKHKTAFLTPKQAGPDFEVQGEYVGKVHNGQMTVGLQIIAMGDGQFEGVVYPGGLPGAGWQGEQKIAMKGKTDGEMTVLNSDAGSAQIKDGMITAFDPNGMKIGELKKVVRKSPTLGQKPPEGAVVLFDGKSADSFLNGRLIDGMLQEGMTSKQKFGSFKLHMEFMLSFMPYARGQQRSNSGVYMQGRYECQILDSFGLDGKHNECGGIYKIAKPKVNMCLPPLSWQTYDVEFRAARFDESGKKTENARITVLHNGVPIHENVDAKHATTASPVKEGAGDGPIYIQNHGNPLRFRNIWLVPTDQK
ncbi:MAG: DUF1080 domain-containing protein [Planctomycetaceae bacterium]